MTSVQIPPRDVEMLSAYTDDQLPPAERARLEARLSEDSVLRDGLDDLRRTRALIRSQPRLRAPRNFTLTPEMAGIRRPAPLPGTFSMFRLASALATFFLGLFLIGELLIRTAQPSTDALLALAPARTNGAQEAAQPVVGMGGGGGGVENPQPAFVEPALESEIAPMAAAKAPEPAPGAMAVTPLGPAELETSTPPGALDMAIERAPAPFAEAELPEGQPTPQPVTISGWSLLRAIQVGLLILAIMAGAVALYLRRSARL